MTMPAETQRQFLVNHFFPDDSAPEEKWHEFPHVSGFWRAAPVTDDEERRLVLAYRTTDAGALDSFCLPSDDQQPVEHVSTSLLLSSEEIATDVDIQAELGMNVANEASQLLLDELVTVITLMEEMEASIQNG